MANRGAASAESHPSGFQEENLGHIEECLQLEVPLIHHHLLRIETFVANRDVASVVIQAQNLHRRRECPQVEVPSIRRHQLMLQTLLNR